MKRIILFSCSILLLSITVFAKDFKSGEVYGKIKSSKTITIGISKHYPPLNFKSNSKGVEKEMISLLKKYLNVQVKVVPMSVREYIPALEKGTVDIVIAGLSRNLVRGKRIWFSKPYLSATPAVLANKRRLPQTTFGESFQTSKIKTIWDLQNITRFKVAVKKGSSYQHLLERKLPDMPRVLVSSNKEGLKLLSDGSVHGFVHDSIYLQYLYRSSARYRSGFVLLQGGSQSEKICIGLPKGDVALKINIDLFVDEIVRQGYVSDWLKKYNR